MNNQPFLSGLPWVFDGLMEFEIVVQDRALWRRKDGFFRVDLYPRVRPKIYERHFGYWDIPLKMISQERTMARLNLHKGTLELRKERKRETWRRVPRLRASFNEPGNIVLHFSSWFINKRK